MATYTVQYTIENHTEQTFDSFNSYDIVGSIVSTPPVVALEPNTPVVFCGNNDNVSEIYSNMIAKCAALGVELGPDGITLKIDFVDEQEWPPEEE